MERLPDINEDVVDIPTLYFNFYDNIILFDHHHSKVYVTELERMIGGVSQIDSIINTIKNGKAVHYNDFEKKNL